MNEEYVRQQYEDMKRNREQYVKNAKQKGKRIAVFFFVIAVLYAVFGIVQVSTCTEKVNAVVIEVNREYNLTRRSRHHFGSGNRDRYKYCPVFEYTYNGEKYTSGGGISSIRETEFKVGDTEEIYVNPNDPTLLYMSGERTVFVKGFVFLIMIGAVFYFLLAVLPVKMNKPEDRGIYR